MRGPKGPLGGPWGNPKCPKMAELQQNLVIFPFKSYLNYLTNLFSTSFDLSSNFVKEKRYSLQIGPLGVPNVRSQIPQNPAHFKNLKIFIDKRLGSNVCNLIWNMIWWKGITNSMLVSLQKFPVGGPQCLTSHPRIAHGQRYPMPCWEWSSEEVEWEQGSGPKGPMSCRTQGGISIRPEEAHFWQ